MYERPPYNLLIEKNIVCRLCHTGNSRRKRPNPAVCLPGEGVKRGIELEYALVHPNPALALEPA